jgi:hypothetical protein
MNDIPEIFNQILYNTLRPWLDINKPDEKFEPMIRELPTIEPHFHQTYEFDFIRPFNSKTRYYHKLIVNETNDYINHILKLIKADTDPNLMLYWLNDTLNKKLKTLLKDTGKLIKDNDLHLEYINPHKIIFKEDIDHKTDTYIIQLFKTALIKAYLEIQNAFRSLLTDSLFEPDDFYTQLLYETVPDNKYLKPTAPVIYAEPETLQIVAEEKTKLVYSSTQTFKYKKMATHPDAIKDLCDSLKLHGFIDKQTTLPDFKKIFSGEKLNNPVVWTGHISDLYYFIVLIHNEHKYVENLRQQHWKVTCNCFIKPDGTTFDNQALKTQKKPKLNALIIQKTVALLK